jgi:hypothetical protein
MMRALENQKLGELHKEERKLFDQLLDLQIKVNLKKLIHGFWNCLPTEG